MFRRIGRFTLMSYTPGMGVSFRCMRSTSDEQHMPETSISVTVGVALEVDAGSPRGAASSTRTSASESVAIGTTRASAAIGNAT